MRPALALFLVVALAAPAAGGDVYRWMDGGTVVYSQQPPPPGVALIAPPGAPQAAVSVAPPDPPVPTDPATATTTPAPPALSPPAMSTGPATAEEILEISGLRPQLDGIARALGLEFVPRQGGVSPREAATISQIVARHLEPGRLYAGILDDFRRRVDDKQLDEMALWFRSPLGHKVTATEIAASRPDATAKLAAFAESLKTAPASRARVDLVQRLDWITGVSEETTEILLLVSASFARAAAASVPPERRASAGVLQRRVDEMRGRLSQIVADQMQTQMLYVYSSLDDAELKQYVDFAASPAGRAYGRAAHGALIRVVREVADRTARDIVRAVPIQRLAGQQAAGSALPGEVPAR